MFKSHDTRSIIFSFFDYAQWGLSPNSILKPISNRFGNKNNQSIINMFKFSLTIAKSIFPVPFFDWYLVCFVTFFLSSNELCIFDRKFSHMACVLSFTALQLQSHCRQNYFWFSPTFVWIWMEKKRLKKQKQNKNFAWNAWQFWMKLF